LAAGSVVTVRFGAKTTDWPPLTALFAWFMTPFSVCFPEKPATIAKECFVYSRRLPC